jgi:hypothetical protein
MDLNCSEPRKRFIAYREAYCINVKSAKPFYDDCMNLQPSLPVSNATDGTVLGEICCTVPATDFAER